jgi:hypothetical protein
LRICHLADEGDENRDLLAAAGAAGHVAAALRAHPENAALQGAGCRALVGMAEKHPANAAAAREAGGVQLIASAIRAYPDNEPVQKHGRRALGVLEPGHALLA